MTHAAAEKPGVAIGHVSLAVADIDASYRFYVDVGLRPFMKEDGLAILELAGGTHLLLFPRGGPESPDSPEATQGLDLMISGRSLEDLTGFRSRLMEKGVQASAIPSERRHGHYRFTATDPDGNEVTVYTSHAGDLPI